MSLSRCRLLKFKIILSEHEKLHFPLLNHHPATPLDRRVRSGKGCQATYLQWLADFYLKMYEEAVDGGESREDTFFRNLSEHFSAQARR